MSTILTNNEIDAAWEGPTPSGYGKSRYDIARAIVATYEAKLARQEPYCYHDGRNIVGKEFASHSDVFPLYTHPAPQQADRQRVPDSYVLVPVEPTIEMLEAMHTESLTFYASEQREAYADMLAAAPEAPAQAAPAEWREAGKAARDVLIRFEITGPDDDGLSWLVLRGKGTNGSAMINLGSDEQIVGKVAAMFEQDRRAALAQLEAPAQASAVDERAVDAAARKIAECMDYPWEHMPEKGRSTMREHAKSVLDAARAALAQKGAA